MATKKLYVALDRYDFSRILDRVIPKKKNY